VRLTRGAIVDARVPQVSGNALGIHEVTVAVLAEMYSIVVRVSTLLAYYPGGVATYEADCPNRTFCSDGEVCRVGFMAWADAEAFLLSLRRFSITLEAGVVGIIREDKGLLRESQWLEFHRIEGTPTARLVDSTVEVFVAPPGWVPGGRQVLTSEADLLQQELVADQNGVASYRDATTGEILHVGRALTEHPHPNAGVDGVEKALSRKPWWKIWM
jgi:hypothetical protein